MKSYIKLYGPSIDRGIDALDELTRDLKNRYKHGESISHIISIIDPDYDMITGKHILKGIEQLGEYDYYVEWMFPPTTEQVRGLIKCIDEALMYTGCRYTITTKR